MPRLDASPVSVTPRLLMFCALVALALTGCVEEERSHLGTFDEALAIPGSWKAPVEVLAVGDTQDNVTYTSAGNWTGSGSCSGGMEPGTIILRDWLYANYPQISHIGGYACRAIVGNSSKMSVHATGRALDIMIPLDGGEADNGAGDPIAHFLIEHAEEIGIQYIIWDRSTWGPHRPDGDKHRDYGGQHPHHDHLHIELSVKGANMQTDWFQGPMAGPTQDPCEIVHSTGGVLDDEGACFTAFGPSQYWRSETTGFNGKLHWTNAFEASQPSNWARWAVWVEATGEYDVDVYMTTPFNVYDAARYKVTHADGADTVYLDQTAGKDWVRLGTYRFEEGTASFVDLYDNVSSAIGSDQHIIADAIRVTPVGGMPPDVTPDPDPVDPDPVTPDPVDPDPMDPVMDPTPDDPDPMDPITEPMDQDTSKDQTYGDLGNTPSMPGDSGVDSVDGARTRHVTGGCTQTPDGDAPAPWWLAALAIGGVVVLRTRVR